MEGIVIADFYVQFRDNVEKALAIRIDGTVTDNGHYFDGMKIMEASKLYTCHMDSSLINVST